MPVCQEEEIPRGDSPEHDHMRSEFRKEFEKQLFEKWEKEIKQLQARYKEISEKSKKEKQVKPKAEWSQFVKLKVKEDGECDGTTEPYLAFICPICGNIVMERHFHRIGEEDEWHSDHRKQFYCSDCGREIDWSDV